MRAASCSVLLCLIYQSTALHLHLPDVVLHTTSDPDLKDIVQPKKEGPLNLNDVDNEHYRYVLIYQWCIAYNYCKPPTEKPINMAVDKIKAALCEPVKTIKSFYRLDDSNCEMTKELLNIMSQPRCSQGDTCQSGSCRRKKRWSRLGSNTWKTMPVTYRIKTPLVSSSFSLADQEALVQLCSKLWTENSGLSMQFLAYSPQADIEVEYAYIDGPWGVVGKGLSPAYRGSSYLRLDNSEYWKRNRDDYGQGVSMQWALCHEMGHNLGLGHSGDMNAIMYPSGVGQDDSRLASDDIQGIQTLYGGPSKKQVPNPTPPPPPPQTTYWTTKPNTPPPTNPQPQPTYRTSAPYRPPTPQQQPAPTPIRQPPPPPPPQYRPPPTPTTFKIPSSTFASPPPSTPAVQRPTPPVPVPHNQPALQQQTTQRASTTPPPPTPTKNNPIHPQPQPTHRTPAPNPPPQPYSEQNSQPSSPPPSAAAYRPPNPPSQTTSKTSAPTYAPLPQLPSTITVPAPSTNRPPGYSPRYAPVGYSPRTRPVTTTRMSYAEFVSRQRYFIPY